jgi:hypothetical protein
MTLEEMRDKAAEVLHAANWPEGPDRRNVDYGNRVIGKGTWEEVQELATAVIKAVDEPDVDELFGRILAAVIDEFPKFAAEVSLMKYRWEERANGLS